MRPQPKPRPALHTPDAAALRCARVQLAAWKRGFPRVERGVADDLRALLAAWDAAHVAAIEWTGGLVCAYGACRDPVSDECERHGTHYCAAHGPEHQRCYGCVLVPLSGEP